MREQIQDRYFLLVMVLAIIGCFVLGYFAQPLGCECGQMGIGVVFAVAEYGCL